MLIISGTLINRLSVLMVEYSENPSLPSREETLLRLQAARKPKEKKAPRPIAKVSIKKKQKMSDEKMALGGGDTLKENWFNARRKEMVGTCQCGCGKPSQKKDDLYFRHSAAHIFPKAVFESVMYHPLNFVERAFFGGCHTSMDESGLHKWGNMADFDDIKEKFYILAPLLTDEERGKKFYQILEKLVYGK
jgi:hypothetical protein